MKDPHIHAEKTLMAGFGQDEMRDLIARSTGLACDLLKTCGTWCGKRRPLAATSKIPEKVTCLTCRERAAADYDEHAGTGEMLSPYLLTDPASFGYTARQAEDKAVLIRDEARKNRETAARFRGGDQR